MGHGVGQKFLANPQSNFLQQKIPKNRSFRGFLRSHYNLNIFKFSASGQNCTHPAFWPAARVRRTSVFTAGENLGAGAALPTPSIEIPKGGDRLWRSEPKTKGHPKGCPFVLELLPRFELGTSSLPTDWEDEVFCFPGLLCPFQSGVPSFPALLCPLSPLLRFPVWVTVWVRGP